VPELLQQRSMKLRFLYLILLCVMPLKERGAQFLSDSASYPSSAMTSAAAGIAI
jgi:hypothetical protein